LQFFLGHNLSKFKKGQISQIKPPENQYEGVIGQKKANGKVRFGLRGRLEEKTASKNLPEKIWMVSQSSSVNEFQTAKTVQKSTDFRSTIWAVSANDHSPIIQCLVIKLSRVQLSHRSQKISPSKWPAAGILGPDLVN